MNLCLVSRLHYELNSVCEHFNLRLTLRSICMYEKVVVEPRGFCGARRLNLIAD